MSKEIKIQVHGKTLTREPKARHLRAMHEKRKHHDRQEWRHEREEILLEHNGRNRYE
jgi:hypothetical protein